MNALTEPVVSVIMPVYNSERFLSEAVESILRQSFSNFELIIIDDGSTDASWEKIQSIQDSRIVRLQNEKNSGIMASFMKGLAAARGEYIANMDSDDISTPERFAAQYNYLEKHPEVAVLGTPIQYMQEDGSKLENFWRPPAGPMVIRWTLFFENALANPTAIMRKQSLGFFYKEPPITLYSFDYEMWLKLAETSAIANLEQPMLFYRMHSTSYSNTNLKKLRLEDITIKNMAMEKFLGKSIGEDVIRMIAHPEPGKDDLADRTLEVLIRFRSKFLTSFSPGHQDYAGLHEDFLRRFYPLISLYPKKGRWLKYYLYLMRIDPPYRKKLARKLIQPFKR